MRLLGLAMFVVRIAAGQTLTLTFDRPEVVPHGVSIFVRPIWSGPFLVGADLNDSSSPIIWTLDRGGRKEEIRFSIPEAANVLIYNLAASADGTIVAAGHASDAHGMRFGFIATIPRDRQNIGIVRDDLFRPELATVTPDGVVWVIGAQLQEDKNTHVGNVLKRYSPSGKLLTSRRADGGECHRLNCYLRGGKERVGWFQQSGYTEFSLDGTVISRFPAPPWGNKYPQPMFAMNDNLQAVATDLGSSRPMWMLDRIKRVWNPITTDEACPMLLGFDGPQLVLQHSTKDRGVVLAHYLLNDDPH
jgi:hypothetical protein